MISRVYLSELLGAVSMGIDSVTPVVNSPSLPIGELPFSPPQAAAEAVRNIAAARAGMSALFKML